MSELVSLLSQSFSGLWHLFVFPGGVFALAFGLFMKGCDRKLEARLQRRIGPPLVQPFYDIAKLFSKELIIPEQASRKVFLAAPLIGFTGMAICAALVPVPGVYAGMSNMGDMLVLFYLLALPAIGLLVAGSSSASPYGALGLSREMTMMFAYEMPLLLTILAVAMLVGGDAGPEFSLSKVVAHQAEYGQFGFSLIMLPAFVAYLMYLPGAIGTPPFDIAEAETEILEGPLLEYSGPALAFFHITAALKAVVVTGVGVVLFFPATIMGGAVVNLLWFMVKCLLLYFFAVTLVKAATGRFRVEQALLFYMKVPGPLASVSLALAWIFS